MKKILLILMLIPTFLIACNNQSEENAEGSEGSGSEEESYTIGFSQATMNHPFRVAMVEDFEDYINENHPNIEVIVTDGQDNGSTQVSDVNTLVSRNIDLLVISPHSSDALTPVVEQVMESGTPVVTVDRTVNTPVT